MNKLFINLSLKGQSTHREFGYVRYIAGDWGHNDRSVHRWGHNDRSVHRWGLGYKSDCV
ncbi:MAG: hypothetical protein ACFKPT_15325 [Gloeotrichia echinulata GP01]